MGIRELMNEGHRPASFSSNKCPKCDRIRAQVEKRKKHSQGLKETLKPGDYVQNFACGEVYAYEKVLDLLDGESDGK